MIIEVLLSMNAHQALHHGLTVQLELCRSIDCMLIMSADEFRERFVHCDSIQTAYEKLHDVAYGSSGD